MTFYQTFSNFSGCIFRRKQPPNGRFSWKHTMTEPTSSLYTPAIKTVSRTKPSWKINSALGERSAGRHCDRSISLVLSLSLSLPEAQRKRSPQLTIHPRPWLFFPSNSTFNLTAQTKGTHGETVRDNVYIATRTRWRRARARETIDNLFYIRRLCAQYIHRQSTAPRIARGEKERLRAYTVQDAHNGPAADNGIVSRGLGLCKTWKRKKASSLSLQICYIYVCVATAWRLSSPLILAISFALKALKLRVLRSAVAAAVAAAVA